VAGIEGFHRLVVPGSAVGADSSDVGLLVD
jgi:hypothetical protein